VAQLLENFKFLAFHQKCYFLSICGPNSKFRVPTHPGKWGKSWNFIPLAPGRVMASKIEKTVKTLEICLPEVGH
jgi:hypothetical protein